VHSVVSQEVIASYAQKLNLHAVCQRAASGQLLFLGLSGIVYETVRPEPVEGVFTIAKSFDKACPEHVQGLSPNGSNANE